MKLKFAYVVVFRLISCVVASIATSAIVGQAFGLSELADWRGPSRMAYPTATSLILLATALFALTTERAHHGGSSAT